MQSARPRIAFHRVYPGGGSNWQLQATLHRALRLPPGLSRWGQQLTATSFAALNASLSLGAKPQAESREGARWVAASRGSTGTRPAEAQESCKG